VLVLMNSKLVSDQRMTPCLTPYLSSYYNYEDEVMYLVRRKSIHYSESINLVMLPTTVINKQACITVLNVQLFPRVLTICPWGDAVDTWDSGLSCWPLIELLIYGSY